MLRWGRPWSEALRLDPALIPRKHGPVVGRWSHLCRLEVLKPERFVQPDCGLQDMVRL